MIGRIQFVVRNYKTLQGLALVACGVGLLAFTAWRIWLLRIIFPAGLNEWSFLLQFLLWAAIIAGLTYIAQSYYRRRFGQANQPSLSQFTTSTMSGWVLFCCVLVSATILGLWLDVNLHPHISFLALAMALILGMRWNYLGRRLHYYLVLAGLMVVVSLLPLFDVVYQQVSQPQSDTYSYILSTVISLLLIAIGLCDHLALLQSMRAVHISTQTHNQQPRTQ